MKLDNAEADNRIGLEMERKGDLNGVLGQYREALRISPENAQYHVNLANLSYREGQRETAAAEYQKAIALGLETAEINNRVGYTLAEIGRFDEALPYLEQASGSSRATRTR